ncbi:ferrous iron transport protein B [candidate division WOR-1 bacterium RIFCSPLOWO2_02_FULL_46_20]|uniref:Ferrous iron transport protein B n=1 Tax=candidate division WOR-1 bacterium RIFCSPLOWO2_02_FULL_46_20 TaxID=1802567 RepID=A0A1F4RGC7_UNCSA|nr:MAG: ferrous iron transport protein B [candidate division WOR-1 bacterium RIFCSPLOWO2_02_FULL_46_20]
MHELEGKVNLDFSGMPKIVLAGNPNVGKSVVFAHLTGQYVTVSNYPGTTVEISRGIGKLKGQRIEIVDAPGMNSLTPSSEDEKVARDLLLKEEPASIIQIADAKNLRRTLLLTLQLIETGLPLLLDLNMMDELKQRRMSVDRHKLSEILQIPIVFTVATEGVGISELKKIALEGKRSSLKINYGEKIEHAVADIGKLLPGFFVSGRAISLMFLSYDLSIELWLVERFGQEVLTKAQAIRQELQANFARKLNQIIGEIRQREVVRLVKRVLTTKPVAMLFMQRLGNITMRPLTGIPILLFILYLMYKFVGELAAQLGVNYLEEVVFGTYLNPWASGVVAWLIPIKFIQEFLVGDYGIITMALTYAFAIVLPIITAFFIFFSLLEDSGYLPRLAILLNRAFRIIGLSGKAVIPLVLGLGCDTMATMTTRTLETKRERIIATLLLALAIPCSAQLGVILGMIGGLSTKATTIWAGVVIGVLLLVGFIAAKILPGESSDFILEIPPLRVPKISNILVKTLARLEWYLREAVPLFILGTMILFFLDKFQLLVILENLASPIVVNFLGLPAKATQAFLIGFLRRDYGAAGLFALARQGLMSPVQIVVSLVTITLFVPCIAQVLVMIKERGARVTFWIVAFVFPFAFLVGGILNLILRVMRVSL